MYPTSAQYNRPTASGAEPGRYGQQHRQSTTDFSPDFHLLPHDILIKNLFYKELRGHSRWIKNPLMDRFPKWPC